MAFKSNFSKDKYAEGSEAELVEKVIFINRVAKVVKGGRRFSFSALVVVGDRINKVGIGFGKASEVPEAIKKAINSAKREIKQIVLVDGTIPHEIIGHFGAGKVFMKPASRGTGVIAGGPVRAIMESLGVKDILTKSLGTSNSRNVVQATMQGLESMRNAEMIRAVRKKDPEMQDDDDETA